MCQPDQSSVIYPVVVVEVEGVRCPALLDPGSGNSYVSFTLMNFTKKKPVKQGIKTLEMMLHATTRTIDIYNVKISDINRNFSMSSEVNCVERPVQLTSPNPKKRKRRVVTETLLQIIHIQRA